MPPELKPRKGNISIDPWLFRPTLMLFKVVHDKSTGNMFTAVICAQIAPLKPNNVTYMQVIEPPLRRTIHILSTLCHYRSEGTTKTQKCTHLQPFRIIHFYRSVAECRRTRDHLSRKKGRGSFLSWRWWTESHSNIIYSSV